MEYRKVQFFYNWRYITPLIIDISLSDAQLEILSQSVRDYPIVIYFFIFVNRFSFVNYLPVKFII